MEQIKDHFTPEIPTVRLSLLKKLKLSGIKKMTRASIDTIDEFQTFSGSSGYDKKEFFRLTYGPFLVEMNDGAVIGFSNDESVNSVLVYLQKSKEGVVNPEADFEEDPDFTFLTTTNEEYLDGPFKSMEDSRITDLFILKRKPESAKHVRLPNEVGVLLNFENGTHLIIAHALGFAADTFFLTFKENIPNEIWRELEFIEIDES